MSRSRRVLAAALTAFLLTTAPVLAEGEVDAPAWAGKQTRETASTEPDPWMDKVWAIIQASPKDAPGDVLAKSLGDLGPGAIPALFTIYGQVSGEIGAAVRRDVILGALRLQPTQPLTAYLRAAALGDAPLDIRLRTLQILAECGGQGGVQLVIEIASELKPIELRSFILAGAIRSSLSGILVRDEIGLSLVKRAWPTLVPELRDIVLAAIEESSTRDGFAFLAELLGTDADTNVAVMRHMIRMPRLNSPAIDEAGLRVLRALLHEQHTEVRRVAVYLAAVVHDAPSFELLKELLADDDPGVAEAALWALQRMSNCNYGADPATWTEWLEAEREWQTADRPREIPLLASEDSLLVIATLGSLSRRRLDGAEIVTDIAKCLGHTDPAVRRAACATLGALGSAASLPHLLRSLDDKDSGVRADAFAALVQITGMKNRLDAAGWKRLLR